MAPAKAPVAPYVKDERVLCFHHEMLYEAKVLDVRLAEDNVSWECKIHYKGWKATWDDWVPSDRVRKFTEENKALAQQLQEQMKALQQQKSTPAKASKAKKNGSDFSSARGSEERGSVVAAQAQRSARRMKDFDLESEQEHNSKAKVDLPMTDLIKNLLVDDWENVTKMQLLVPLPVEYPVEAILEEWKAEEMTKRGPLSQEITFLEEVIAGLKEYFTAFCGHTLLYKFEREQYHQLQLNWNSPNPDPTISGKDVLTTYGFEHLLRLLSNLPELVANTNMDAQSCKRLDIELQKLTAWLCEERNVQRYVCREYESPGQAYIDKSRA